MIAEAEHEFVSRGDLSGTNKKELAIWRIAGHQAFGPMVLGNGLRAWAGAEHIRGQECLYAVGQSDLAQIPQQGPTRDCFRRGKGSFNQYGIVAVDPNHCPSAKTRLTAIFVDWMLSKEGQRAIGEYSPDETQLFVPNAVEAE